MCLRGNKFCPHFDAVALPHGDPHGEADGRDEAEIVQQGETETLAVSLGGHTGEAGETPKRKTAWKRKDETHSQQVINKKHTFQLSNCI